MTQLTLINGDPEPNASATGRARRSRATGQAQANKNGRSRARVVEHADRRAVRWTGDWRLDEHTRAIGLQGVGRARQALRQTNPGEPGRARHLDETPMTKAG